MYVHGFILIQTYNRRAFFCLGVLVDVDGCGDLEVDGCDGVDVAG